tara:strand:+ start:3726 stop:4856 length:1131 start_codon:yes stop_codon:yes gene_type:complete
MANTLKFGNSEWYGSEGNILAYNDLGGNYKPLPFSFSRGSSATRVNQQGLIETVQANDARVDYKDNANGALLLEPSRTNKLTTSQDFSSFLKSGTITTTANYGISPNGKQDSTRVVFSSSSSSFYKLSVHSGNTETNSIYIKGTNGETIKFGKGVTVNLGDTFTLNGEWQRLEYVSTTGNQFIINTYGGTTARDIEIFGAQIEEGSYATSYIPTQGTAQTRLKDSCSQTTPDGVIGQTEGTVFVEIDYTPHSVNYESVASLQGTSTQQYLECYFNSANKINVGIYNGGAVQVSFASASQTKGIKKIAIAYKSNDFAVYLNGTQIHTDNSGSVPLLSSLGLGINYSGSTFQLSQPIKQFQLYNTRLSNGELAALTQV